MSKISIAEEEKQINQVLLESKERLIAVRDKIEMLDKEHSSILEDI